MYKVVYLQVLPSAVLEIAQSQLPDGFCLDAPCELSRDCVLRSVADADFILVATTPVTEEIIAQAPSLKLIQHQGVGFDNIDLDAAARRGIPVALTPEGTTVGVAEHVVLLILALYKHLRQADAALRRGEWLQWDLRAKSYEIKDKTVGIVGLGRIGRAVVSRLGAFEVNEILYSDVGRLASDDETDLAVTFSSLDELLRRSDIVSLHAPLNDHTRGMIGVRELEMMSRHAVLINTARGALIDETALYHALCTGQIAGAGIDVFAMEPPSTANPLLTLDNVVLTPHIAAGTSDALRVKLRAAFANMLRVLEGNVPIHQVTPDQGAKDVG